MVQAIGPLKEKKITIFKIDLLAEATVDMEGDFLTLARDYYKNITDFTLEDLAVSPCLNCAVTMKLTGQGIDTTTNKQTKDYWLKVKERNFYYLLRGEANQAEELDQLDDIFNGFYLFE